mgnify:CR=1 FL=1
MLKTIVITPVRNEEEYIEKTVGAMIRQTVKPVKWIVVNDGSGDKTRDIIAKYRHIPYMHLVDLPDRGFRLPGQGVVEAFYMGLATASGLDYDILVKMDGDLYFDPDTFELVLKEFEKDKRLGISSGTRYDRRKHSSGFKKVIVPVGYVGGPFKFYRRECFHQIGGLIRRSGWDGVDIVKARMLGWDTKEIPHVKFYHMRPTGTANGEGLKKANIKYGEVSYHMGGYLWYFAFRVIGRSILSRSVRCGAHMILGYTRSASLRLPREDKEFRKYMKKMQLVNTRGYLNMLLRKKSHNNFFKKY